MITIISEFRDAVAFETYVLDKMLPVISKGEKRTIDLRGEGTDAAIQISINESASAGTVDRVKNDLAPLIFGAAWKVLDLALELVFNNGGLTPDQRNGTEWSISAKRNLAAQGAGQFQMLTSDPLIWAAVRAL
jgi:hypothetical protein